MAVRRAETEQTLQRKALCYLQELYTGPDLFKQQLALPVLTHSPVETTTKIPPSIKLLPSNHF